ncbi:hypothetical protein ACFXAZ_25450 [Streptomyces sp. NPDC059477]|uniref:hypothetical protein n=1 Tax=Streptomyces sp. NPDC059477 TaxID=3346847 RepID=UPI003682212C
MTPQPDGALVPSSKARCTSPAPRSSGLDRSGPFGVTDVLVEGEGYRISLTEAFTR